MNTFIKRLATVTVSFSLICLAADVAAKKPVKPPPDPEPTDPGSLCADSGSFFPAFAYVFTGEIFLSNSAGDCSISIYKTDTNLMGVPTNISYRFFTGPEEDNDHGKIVWTERDPGDTSIMKIQLMEFQVEAGAITTALPLSPRVILLEPDNVSSIGAADLSPDGNKVIVTAHETDQVRGYIWEFDIPESGVAEIGDIRELARLDVNEDPVENATFHNIRYGLSDQSERVYFSYGYPDRRISYIEKGTDGWSEPVLIAERPNGDLGPGAVGLWDFGSGLKEVLTFSTTISGNGPIEILDVEACVEGVGDCVVLDYIDGWVGTSFTTFTEGQLPALLYLYVAEARTRHKVFSIRECGLDAALESPDACNRTVIDGIKDAKRTIYGVDSAD